MSKNLPEPSEGQFLFYSTEDGKTRVQVLLDGRTCWMPQSHIAELFDTTTQNITQHIKKIYDERELEESATCKDYLQVQTEGNRQVKRTLAIYNLEMIIAIGYRVRSSRGTQFRRWATETLREYLVKGFTMDDDRLKRAGGGEYFEELLARIRDIRSSERVFWRKVLDIYATSIDYDPGAESSTLFFKTIQNKMHWAAHGHTAAEVIHVRADADQPNMGLTSFDGNKPRKADVTIAKNYLAEDEINILNRIVTAYLEFAELQALNRKPMTMANWVGKLDDFLRLTDREILDHAGKISHDVAVEKAEQELVAYRQQQARLPQPVDEHFAESLDELMNIEDLAKRRSKEDGENDIC